MTNLALIGFLDFCERQCDQLIRSKMPNFWKKQPKQLLSQNIYIKAKFLSPKHQHQTTFETLKIPTTHNSLKQIN
jgi:hypothetical protein